MLTVNGGDKKLGRFELKISNINNYVFENIPVRHLCRKIFMSYVCIRANKIFSSDHLRTGFGVTAASSAQDRSMSRNLKTTGFPNNINHYS